MAGTKMIARTVTLLAHVGSAPIVACAQDHPNWQDPIQIGVGEAPGSVALADLNHDGHLDLLTANGGSGTLSVLLGGGDGSFTEASDSPFPAGQHPNDIAIADLDRDGHLDVAIPNHETDYMSILFGDGTGRLTPAPYSPVRVSSRPHPHGVTAADFDVDGWIDLAVESFQEDKIIVLWGGTSPFAEQSSVQVGRLPYQNVRSIDVDHDGRLDLVTTNRNSDNVSVMLSSNGRTFQEATSSPIVVSPSPFSQAVGDLNADGCADVAIVHYSGNLSDRSRDAVSMLVSDCEGGFDPAVAMPFDQCAAPVSVAIGDVTGDGQSDIAAACYGSDEVELLIANSGSYGRETLSVGRRPQWVALGDLNGDGRADIVTADSESNQVTLFLSR